MCIRDRETAAERMRMPDIFTITELFFFFSLRFSVTSIPPAPDVYKRQEEAVSGEEALRKVKEGGFDLILLDVMMPGLNGYQTCVEIRKTTNVPILFLSARSQVEDKTMGLLSGGDDYLPGSYTHLLHL